MCKSSSANDELHVSDKREGDQYRGVNDLRCCCQFLTDVAVNSLQINIIYTTS